MNLELQLHAQLERNDIREEEKLELVKRNPTVHFEIPSMTFGEGRQSRVSALEIKKENTTQKVIWKRCGVEKKLHKEEAENLCKRLTPYREVLRIYGWNVPNIFYSEVVEQESGYVVFSYEELIEAIDTERMFKEVSTAHFERLAVLQKIITTLTNKEHEHLLKKEYFGRTFSQLPYGIDLKLANLILDEQGSLHFVDFFGPKELTPEGVWKTYNTKLDSLSQEKLLVVCATREGCILRMLKLALRHLPHKDMTIVYFNHFKDIITHSPLPEYEKQYILQELENGFPLLTSVYEESKV